MISAGATLRDRRFPPRQVRSCTHITTGQARSRSGPATGPTATPQGGEHRLFGAPGQAPWPKARATPMPRSPPASRTAGSRGRDRHGAPQPPGPPPGAGAGRPVVVAAQLGCGHPAAALRSQHQFQPTLAVSRSATMSTADRRAPSSISPFRCADPPGSAVHPLLDAPASRRTCPSALRARCVSTCATVHPGNRLGERTCSSVMCSTLATSRACAARHTQSPQRISVQITRHSLQPPTRRHALCRQPFSLPAESTDFRAEDGRTLRGATGPRRVGRKSAQASGTAIVLNLDPFHHDRPLPTAALNGRYGWRSANRHLRPSVTE